MKQLWKKNEPNLLVLKRKRPLDEELIRSLEALLERAKNGEILSVSMAVEEVDAISWFTSGDSVAPSSHIYCLERLKNELLFGSPEEI